jgi:hypothetical protein
MRGKGAERIVVVLKLLQWRWSEGSAFFGRKWASTDSQEERSLMAGSFVETQLPEEWEPYESRGSRTVLREAEAEMPRPTHHCKTLGKQALHLGGATQLLFGIKGKRWEDPKQDYGKRFFNEYWVRPLPHEIPEGSESVEGGCYW